MRDPGGSSGVLRDRLLGVVFASLVFAAIGGSRPDLGFWTNFSVALGFVGLAMMGLEFALVARFEAMASPSGCGARST